MPLYDILIISRINSNISQLKNIVHQVGQTLKKNESGLFRNIENYGIRPLAYRMRAHKEWNEFGRYTKLSIQSNPLTLKDIEYKLKMNENIIRIYTLKNKKFAPKIPIQQQYDIKEKEEVNEEEEDEISMENYFQDDFKLLDYKAAKILLESGQLSTEDIKKIPLHHPGHAKGNDIEKKKKKKK